MSFIKNRSCLNSINFLNDKLLYYINVEIHAQSILKIQDSGPDKVKIINTVCHISLILGDRESVHALQKTGAVHKVRFLINTLYYLRLMMLSKQLELLMSDTPFC